MLVTIDPFRSRTAEKSDRHLALMPGTDGALALGLMHVAFRDGLEDRDYLERYTIGADALRERVAEWTPARVAETTGLAVADVEWLAHEYATRQPSAIRLNYGLNRHAGAGMAVRAIACLPAVTGAWRHPGGGILLSCSGTFPVNTPALERPDLAPGPTRLLNMSQIGRILLDPSLAPPVKAVFVYNSNPLAVAPESEKVREGFAREDLFTVVHDLFQTDTVDYADVVLPAPTTLEQYDIHKSVRAPLPQPESAGHRAARRVEVQHRHVPGCWPRVMGLDDPALRDSDEDMARQALRWEHPHLAGISFDDLQREGTIRLSVPDPFAPFAEGGFPTPSGKCELFSERVAQEGLDPVPDYVPPRESPRSAPERARRYPLAFISPPAHHFLNSTFSAQPTLMRRESEPIVFVHPEDAAAARDRGGRDGARLQRPRVVRGAGGGVGRRPAGRGRRPVHLVAQALAGRAQRQRRDQPGADGHGRRGDVLRLPGRGGGGAAGSGGARGRDAARRRRVRGLAPWSR